MRILIPRSIYNQCSCFQCFSWHLAPLLQIVRRRLQLWWDTSGHFLLVVSFSAGVIGTCAHEEALSRGASGFQDSNKETKLAVHTSQILYPTKKEPCVCELQVGFINTCTLTTNVNKQTEFGPQIQPIAVCFSKSADWNTEMRKKNQTNWKAFFLSV